MNKPLFLLLVIVCVAVGAVYAGGERQESKACDKCRKGKEPLFEKKFPDNVTSCDSPGNVDPTVAYYDGSAENPNCPAPPLPNTNTNQNCYDDPDNTACTKKDEKKGAGKRYSTASNGNTAASIKGLGTVFLVLIVLGVGLWLAANASSRRNFGQTMVNLNLNASVPAPTRDSAAAGLGSTVAPVMKVV